MKSKYLLTLIILCNIVYIFAAPIHVTRKQCLLNKYDRIFSFQKLRDGGYVLTGRRDITTDPTNSDSTQQDLVIWKLDNNFDTLWSKVYGLNLVYGLKTDESGADVVETSNKQILIGGVKIYDNTPKIWILKLDENGDTLWTRYLGGFDGESCNGICEANDGSIGIAGTKEHGSSNITSFYVLKIDSLGDTIWSREFFYEENAEAKSCLFKNGNLIIAGEIPNFQFPVAGGSIAFITELNTDGDTVWTRKYNIDFENTINMIENTNDGGYICTGSVNSTNPRITRTWVMRIDRNGNISWSKEYFGDISVYSEGKAIKQTADGGFALIGDILLNQHYRSVVLRLNENGDSLWSVYSDINGEYFCESVGLLIDKEDRILGLFTATPANGGSDTLIPPTDSYILLIDKETPTFLTTMLKEKIRIGNVKAKKCDLMGRTIDAAILNRSGITLSNGKKYLFLEKNTISRKK